MPHTWPPRGPLSSWRAGVILSEELRLRWEANSLEGAHAVWPGARPWQAQEAGQGQPGSGTQQVLTQHRGRMAGSPPQPRLPLQGARELGPSPPSTVPTTPAAASPAFEAKVGSPAGLGALPSKAQHRDFPGLRGPGAGEGGWGTPGS